MANWFIVSNVTNQVTMILNDIKKEDLQSCNHGNSYREGMYQ